ARDFTLVVAADDSGVIGKASADYICDGVDDDVQINAALNALPAEGGRVALLEGIYVLADPIVIPDDDITLNGQGVSTLIDGDGLADGEHAIEISGMEDVWIGSLSIQTDNGGGNDSDCVAISDGSHDFIIGKIVFVDSDSDAININGTSIWGGTIANCNIVNGDDYGVLVDIGGGSSTRYINITNNLIESVGLDGIRFSDTGSHDYNQIISNILHNNGGSAIRVYDTNGIVINDNNVHTVGGYGICLDTTHYSEINNNSTFNTQLASIYLDGCDANNIVGNNLDSTSGADTEDCIYVDGDENVVSGNYINEPERSGVYVAGHENIISNNVIVDAHLNGINIRDDDNIIEGNLISGAGQKTAGTYHGIILSTDADRCS
ncbi:unnamed protein product, partial [marine sediment metagenome]